MNIDARYDAIMNEKISKLKNENQRKEKVLINKRREDQFKREEE